MNTQIPLPDLHVDLIDRIRNRWRVVDVSWPWLLRPCNVRILFYADFQGAYNTGPFDGLKHVIATLNADPYYWVQFTIAKANRVNDSSADALLRNKTLDQINWADYDELWLFGLSGFPSVLSAAEISAVTNFMNTGGGVLVTGDHEDLGAAIGSSIPRAGKLRAWAIGTAPPVGGGDQHSTLREGHDPGFVFNDQSDDVPQVIRYRTYPVLGRPWAYTWLRQRPHPILCGPDGPIDVLPDHMHEGIITIPANFPNNEWPSKNGLQPKPEVIAWAKIVDPVLNKSGTEFPVLGAYDGHTADVGRIIADATWHHWFDINLIGEGGAVSGDAAGFDVPTISGQAALKKIEAYFLNVAIWLAPPAQQRCMRNRLWWGNLWHDPLIMMSPRLPLYLLGAFGIDALGKNAPQCTVSRFLLEAIDIPIRLQLEKFQLDEQPLPPLIEEHMLGAVLRELLEYARKTQQIPIEVDEDFVDALIDGAFQNAASVGLHAIVELSQQSTERLRELANLTERSNPSLRKKTSTKRPSKKL